MTRMQAISLGGGLLLVLGAAGSVLGAIAPEQSPVPNFSSVDMPWSPIGGIRPPSAGLGPVRTLPSNITRRQLFGGNGDVVDLPLQLLDVNDTNLKPWVTEALKKVNDGRMAEKRSYTSHARCMPGGLPDFLIFGGAFQAMYFVQTPHEVLMVNSADSQVRRVYMNVPHASHLEPSWYGDSVGHYEGDTLVIDTISLNDKTELMDEVPHTAQLHVVERFKLIENGTQLQVEFTIDDPGTFNAPWGGVVTYRHRGAGAPLTESPCAESNALNGGGFFPQGTGSEVIPIPIASKADF